MLLIADGAARLLTDFRYVEQAAGQAPEYEVVKIEALPWPAVAPRPWNWASGAWASRRRTT